MTFNACNFFIFSIIFSYSVNHIFIVNITKLLALILSFQVSVQAVTLKTLKEFYERHRGNRNNAIEERIAETIEQILALRINPITEILGNVDDENNLEERFVHHVDHNNAEGVDRIVERIQELLESRIDIPENIDDANNLEERFVYYLAHNNTNDAGSVAGQINQLLALRIDPTTELVKDIDDAGNLEELFVYHVAHKNTADAKRISKQIKALQGLEIYSNTAIVENIDDAGNLEELFVYHVAHNNTSNADLAAGQIKKLRELKIDVSSTFIHKNVENADTLPERFVYYLVDKNTNDADLVAGQIKKLKELDIYLNTPLKKTEEGTIEEKLVYRLHKNLSIDVLVQELNKKRAPLAQEEVEKGPSKKVKQDDSVCEQKEGVVLLPEKQERKEELPEINEEESVSPKRRHPDSKSE